LQTNSLSFSGEEFYLCGRGVYVKKIKNVIGSLLPLVILIFFVIVWQLVVDTGLIRRYILPSPVDVVKAVVYSFPDFAGHITVTLSESLTGFIFAVIMSLAIAAAVDASAFLKKAAYPLLVISQTIPVILLAPLFAMWFGFGQLPKIVVVVLVCFFPVVLSLIEGFQSVDRDMINMFKSMGASSFKIFTILKLPASATHFFSGLKIAATYSIMAAVIGEWMGGSKGLGVYMIRVKHSFATDKVFAAILIIVVLSMLIFKTISVIQYMAMPWERLLKNTLRTGKNTQGNIYKGG
jgi:ABC-type nitrate/sulfonate/bicarbonate transport system permease component